MQADEADGPERLLSALQACVQGIFIVVVAIGPFNHEFKVFLWLLLLLSTIVVIAIDPFKHEFRVLLLLLLLLLSS